MASRALEIILNSAMDLKNVNLFSKVKAYALVWIEGSHSYPKIQSPRDGENKTNPIWNFPITFMVDELALVNGTLQLIIQIRTDGTVKNKEIGRVTVLLREFVRLTNEGGIHAGTIEYVTRPVIKPSSKIKGNLNFSIKIGERIVAPIPPQLTTPLVFASGMANPIYSTGPFLGPPPRPPLYNSPNLIAQTVSTALPAVLLAEHTQSLLNMTGNGFYNGDNPAYPAYYDGGIAYGGC